MALLSTSHPLFFSKTLNNPRAPSIFKAPHSTLHFSRESHKAPVLRSTTRIHRFPSLIPAYASSSDPTPDPESPSDPVPEPDASARVTDEWGEKADPEPRDLISPDADPPINEDEWEEEYVVGRNGSAAASWAGGVTVEGKEEKIKELKRCLVDTVYGTNLGLRARSEIHAEVAELVNQLEALNPSPVPMEATGLLDGKWVLVYTAFSELLPLLAAVAAPFLKVKRISQAIDASNKSVVSSTTLASPFATFSFSATASFEVRSPSRIQVEFKEGTLQPPEIKFSIDLPENVDLFGQKINLAFIQQSLNPLHEAVANISRAISGQPPLKLPIPGNQSTSWLLITYLDEDLQISRGDGGLFVLVKEESLLVYL